MYILIFMVLEQNICLFFSYVENIALARQTFQSSLGQPIGQSYHAVDGNTDQNHHHGSCIHTGNETNAWWIVDLGRNYEITSVKIYNRAGCCGRYFKQDIKNISLKNNI